MFRMCQLRRIDNHRTSILGKHKVAPLVAPETILVRHSLRVEHFADFVRLMAIDTGG